MMSELVAKLQALDDTFFDVESEPDSEYFSFAESSSDWETCWNCSSKDYDKHNPFAD